MKKLRLDVQSLQVDSFTTRRPSDVAGTVRAHEDLDNTSTFDLGNYTGACSNWCIPQEPVDPNDKYRLPNAAY